MNLEMYSEEDLNMYLSGTFIQYNGTTYYIDHVKLVDGNEDYCDFEHAEYVKIYTLYAQDSELRNDCLIIPVDTDLKTVPPVLGYRDYNNSVVFSYHVQQRHYKKLPSLNSIKVFNPQSKELSAIGIDRHQQLPADSYLRKLLLTKPVYKSLQDAYGFLQNKKHYATALHKNYALVKKANHKDLTIFYKTDPVLTYNGSDLKALVSDCHIQKFLLEVPQ